MSVKSEKIIIGTRGSPLALVQTNIVKDEIAKIRQNIDVEVRVIRTSGDWTPSDGEVRLDVLEGGKAQFATEIEDALLLGEIDVAVHSMKDMETILPKGLVIPYMLPREDARDAFLSNISQNIDDLSTGSVVGSASVRRQAFLLNKRPDLNVVPLRGNVQTRIDKMKSGQIDATFLACAGLNRLGLSGEITSIVSIDDMLPAVGQGAIGIEMREEDTGNLAYINQFCCNETYICVECERAVLRAVGGSCHTPIGVYASIEDGFMRLRVKVVSIDGKHIWSEDESRRVVSRDEAMAFGKEVGMRLKSIVPPEVLSYIDQ